MNCCDEFGNCTGAHGCPVRASPLNTASTDGSDAETNRPWGWINGAGFWLVCILMGLAYGIGYGIVALAKRLSF